MKNVVLYARGGSQEEVNRQFQNMEEALDLDPEANVVARYSDLGSGVDVNRPELKQALDHLENGEVAALFVQSIDRLSRSVQELARLASKFRIEFTKEPENLD